MKVPICPWPIATDTPEMRSPVAASVSTPTNAGHQFVVAVRLPEHDEASGTHDREVANLGIVPGVPQFETIRAHRDAQHREFAGAVGFEFEIPPDFGTPRHESDGDAGNGISGVPVHNLARDPDRLLSRRFTPGGQENRRKGQKSGNPGPTPSVEPSSPIRGFPCRHPVLNHVPRVRSMGITPGPCHPPA